MKAILLILEILRTDPNYTYTVAGNMGKLSMSSRPFSIKLPVEYFDFSFDIYNNWHTNHDNNQNVFPFTFPLNFQNV